MILNEKKISLIFSTVVNNNFILLWMCTSVQLLMCELLHEHVLFIHFPVVQCKCTFSMLCTDDGMLNLSDQLVSQACQTHTSQMKTTTAAE